jgi:hypothetical protein
LLYPELFPWPVLLLLLLLLFVRVEGRGGMAGVELLFTELGGTTVFDDALLIVDEVIVGAAAPDPARSQGLGGATIYRCASRGARVGRGRRVRTK